ncbi:D-aminoacyl-tRNA deacylase [Romboutsia sedimentorum]|jgi:D-tyrosyl-tRNA(Tyr) deacylase|uniref:D-aminoacyl-tRNA deacylase n=1 Tax=Romboutsia sedimentorum TaxID=1368474 RepID=A0ABT7ECM9_9FIRM|nr:D-aminoacyl-tRNA deacylase [Romboutsia sedimentorum]MDK2564673.1 D-aminoacyl-tRNA deacylase [Romboutsia sedimentorum]MDK2586380.1 D-aminoacyl-tRNA deacylase [Romboutsia sedimentorum]
MRAVVQRVSSSKVTVDNNITGQISKGLLVLLGVTHEDTSKDVDYMIDKILNLRIFEDENEKMNLSLKDVGGELLVVSQFTLYGDCRKGKRPSFSNAARPDLATKLYEEFIKKAKSQEIVVGTGEFGAHMMVDLTNDGPVTILLESNKSF